MASKKIISDKEPQLYWMIEDVHEDFENIKLLKECELDIAGLYFSNDICLETAKKF